MDISRFINFVLVLLLASVYGAPETLTTAEPEIVTTNTSTVAYPAPTDANSSTTTQLPRSGLGGSCKINDDCWVQSSGCHSNNTCTCNPSYFRSKRSEKCLKIVEELGGHCTEDEECRKGLDVVVGRTACINFKCSCDLRYVLINGECKAPLVLNTKCASQQDCPIVMSKCLFGECVCKEEMLPNENNNACIPKIIQLKTKNIKAFVNECEETVQCQYLLGEKAYCEGATHTCMCSHPWHLVEGKCVPYKELGSECSLDGECQSRHVTVEHENSRFCNNSVCSCSKGFEQVAYDSCYGGVSGLVSSIFLLVISLITSNGYAAWHS